ncbi:MULTISPECIES: AAA family ATPase [unclassified Nonomuraea]|uniref:ATP-binding protein n=1 Tax=unclassified Nonomuraea TaxID=2593643 RepID=UPI0033F7BF1F
MPTEARPHELIGRDHPAALLRAEITRVVDSHGGLVLVTGEAGIGKTTLVSSAAAEARRRGALVVGGACWDSGSAPGYWPWVQVIRALRRSAAPHEWAEAEQSAGGSLAALLGEAAALAQPHLEVTADTDPASAFQIYDAVTTALVALSQHHPLVIVIDDLHAADPASLRLLEFAARQTWFERLLLVGTYRDAEVEPVDHPLRDLLSPLVAKATTITLTGLDQAGVGALMARTAGLDPPADLVAEVHVRTGGNPFFVEQTARLWRSGGSATAVAPGVRDALLRRLSLLPRPVSELLPAAAVLGREFHRQVLAATVAAPVAHVDRLLDLAVIARLVVTKGGGRFAFAHDLVRETLYDAVADVRDLHAAVVRALDGAPDLARRMLPSDLARHAYLAGDRVDPERAIDLLQAAARAARSRLAGEEELGHLRRAHELSAAAAPRRRVLICLDLGRELRHRGERDEARRMFEEAGAVAADLGDPELTARVALVFRSHYGHDDSLDRLRRAHAELVGEPAPDDRLALDLVFHLAAQARQGGDDDVLAFSLWAHHDIIWGPGTAGERVALTGELLDVARRTSDRELEHFAGALRWVAMIEEGDPRYLDRFHDYAARGRSADDAHLALTTSVDASIVAALAGRFAEAEALMTGLSLDGKDHDFDVMLDHHHWAIRWLQGRVEEQEDVLRRIRSGRHPDRGLLEALTALQAGDVGTALRHHAAGARVGRMAEPLWLRFQAELAAATHDRELAAGARAALLPHRGRWAVSYYGWDISGPYDLWIAVLDLAEGRWAEAAEGFTRAYRSADRMRARPWSVLARARLAEALLAGGDTGRARSLLEEVRREAAELGMHHVLDTLPAQGSAAAEPAPPPAPQRDESPGPDPAAGDFRKDGEVWALRFAGRLAHMPDAKGLRDLHHLLGHPGADIPAVALLAPEGGDLVLAARAMGGDAVLDEEAKADYRRRLSVLDDEIDRAADRGDDDRAAEYDRERAALLEELRTAAGLGGRSRRLGDEAERARKTVTARIRDTLRKLTQTHPELATHLRATISTGATCRYQPTTPITWHL